MTSFNGTTAFFCFAAEAGDSSIHYPYANSGAGYPCALEGKDVLATAQTGTGKTLAFLIPIIEMLQRETGAKSPRAGFAPHARIGHSGQRGVRKIAGQGTLEGRAGNRRRLRKGSDPGGARRSAMVIATPGRLQDFISRKLVDLREIKILVLDEADRMLDMGFLPAIRRILAVLPQRRQTLCFSATMEQSVAGLVNDSMRDPVRVAVGSGAQACRERPLASLRSASRREGRCAAATALCRERTDVDLRPYQAGNGTTGQRVGARRFFRRHESMVTAHNRQRNGALSGFQQGKFQVLVATDVAARGLHIDDVAHVINYDLPKMGRGLQSIASGGLAAPDPKDSPPA